MAAQTNTPVVPRGNGPASDPSALTMQALLREVTTLQELIDSRIHGLSAKIETRLEAMDKALELLQTKADKVPSDVDLSVGRLEALMNEKFRGSTDVMTEKFASVDKQFSQRDTAVNAALAAQEKQAIAQNDSNTKANAKTEDNFTKLIEQARETLQTTVKSFDDKIIQMGALHATAIKGLDDRINANKERITETSGQKSGSADQMKTFMTLGSFAVAVVAVVLAFLR